MVISMAHLSPLLSILFGILILIFPRLLNYLVAFYLILAGLLGIGLIGRPVRAHAQFDQLVPASATAVCRPAPDIGVSLTPGNASHYAEGQGRRSLGLSSQQARGGASWVAASLPVTNGSADRFNATLIARRRLPRRGFAVARWCEETRGCGGPS